MNNTQIQIMAFLTCQPGWTADEFVAEYWPKSKQPEKKARTIEIHFSMLKKAGYVTGINGRYFATKAGHIAFKQCCKDDGKEFIFRKTVPMLRIVS